MQLLILGMHRSGTSMITRLINMMGAYFAPEGASIGFDHDNPKGFWERKDALAINDALLKRQHCEWSQIAPWQSENVTLENAPKLKQAIRALVLNLDAHRPWVLKDPRLCLTLPYWTPYLEVPVAVVVYRDPLEISQSLFTRNRIPHLVGLALWEKYAVTLLNASIHMPRVFVQHRQILEEPLQHLAQLHARLRQLDVQGLRMPSAREISAFIEPKLYRAKADNVPPEAGLTEAQSLVAKLLQGQYAQTTSCTLSLTSEKILRNHQSQAH